jgi:hypothetical protein
MTYTVIVITVVFAAYTTDSRIHVLALTSTSSTELAIVSHLGVEDTCQG